jgi:hypothetical protein
VRTILGPLLFSLAVGICWAGIVWLMGADCWREIGIAAGVAYWLGYNAGRTRVWEPLDLVRKRHP